MQFKVIKSRKIAITFREMIDSGSSKLKFGHLFKLVTVNRTKIK